MCVKLVSAVAQCLYLAVMAAASLLFEFFFSILFYGVRSIYLGVMTDK